MDALYSIIPKDIFESLPQEKQVGLIKVLFPEVIRELREEYLESIGKGKKKDTKSATESFIQELNQKDSHLEIDSDYNADDFLNDLK